MSKISRKSRAERRTILLIMRYCRLVDRAEAARIAALAAHERWEKERA